MLRGPPLSLPRHATIGEALAAAAASSDRATVGGASPAPERIGLTFLDSAERELLLPISELHRRARRAAAALASLGIRPGDRVAILLPTGVDFMDAFFGAVLAGAVPVPLYPPVRLGRLDEFPLRPPRMIEVSGAPPLLTHRRIGRLLRQTGAPARPAPRCRAVAELPRTR